MNCLKCGGHNPEEAIFCNKCGSKIEPYSTSFQGRKQEQHGNRNLILFAAAAVALVVLGAAMLFLLSTNREPQKVNSRSEKSASKPDYIRTVGE